MEGQDRCVVLRQLPVRVQDQGRQLAAGKRARLLRDPVVVGFDDGLYAVRFDNRDSLRPLVHVVPPSVLRPLNLPGHQPEGGGQGQIPLLLLVIAPDLARVGDRRHQDGGRRHHADQEEQQRQEDGRPALAMQFFPQCVHRASSSCLRKH